MNHMGDFVIENGVVIKYTGEDSRVVIPKGVRKIGENAFANRGNITSVTIPEGVTQIGAKAFRFCMMLTYVTFPSTLKSIGAEAFRRCESLREVCLPDGEVELGREAFRDCKGLADAQGFVIVKDVLFSYYGQAQELVIPAYIKNIDPGAYTGLQELKSIVLPEGITTIWSELFCWCEKLTAINIPQSVTIIETKAFRNCKNLADKDGFVIVQNRLFGYFGSGGNIVIPAGVTAIEDTAFYGDKRVHTITIPDSVTYIGEGAFGRCKVLEAVQLPANIKEIGPSAFIGCEELVELTIPEGVTVIREEAFAGCTKLERLQLPETLKSIEDFAFSACGELRTVVIPAGVTSIGRGAFRGCSKLETLIFPPSVTSADNEMLRYLPALLVLVAPGMPLLRIDSKMVRLAAATGYLCYGERYTDPELASDYEAFIRRNRKLILPLLLKMDAAQPLMRMLDMGKIQPKGFEELYLQPAQLIGATGCVAALMQWREQNLPARTGADFLLEELDKDIYDPEELKKLWSFKRLLDGTVCITGYKGSETTIEIPPRVGKRQVSTIGPGFLQPRQKSPGVSVKQVIIPEGATCIEATAFCMCDGLQSVHIPDTVLEIGERAFAGCKGLADKDGFVILGGILFNYYGQSADVVVPEGVRRIEKEAFYENKTMVTIRLPQSLETIENHAFYGCRLLESIQIPGSVRRIGEYAFSWCEKLKRAELAQGVCTIDTGAFGECGGLVTMTIPASVTRIGMWAFNNCDIMTIHAPPGSRAAIYATDHGVPLKGE